MFKRELKVNLKSLLIWLSITIGLFLVVFLMYPSIIDNNNYKAINDMMDLFPKEMLQAFNMDISSIDSVFGWIKTEGFVFLLLITGAYSAILGINILLKEESEKTIEYLNSLPVKRQSIVIQKVLCGLLYITILVIGVAIFNYIGLELSGDFDKKAYILLSITPLFPSYVIFALCLFLSTFAHKTKKMIGISLGIVFVSYFLQMLSGLSDTVEFLKYFSIFTLADTRNVIMTSSLDFTIIIISIISSLTLILLGIIKYNKKDLV